MTSPHCPASIRGRKPPATARAEGENREDDQQQRRSCISGPRARRSRRSACHRRSRCDPLRRVEVEGRGALRQGHPVVPRPGSRQRQSRGQAHFRLRQGRSCRRLQQRRSFQAAVSKHRCPASPLNPAPRKFHPGNNHPPRHWPRSGREVEPDRRGGETRLAGRHHILESSDRMEPGQGTGARGRGGRRLSGVRA